MGIRGSNEQTVFTEPIRNTSLFTFLTFLINLKKKKLIHKLKAHNSQLIFHLQI